MARSRNRGRNRNRNRNKSQQQGQNQGQQQGQGGQGKRRRRRGNRQRQAASLWGEVERLPDPQSGFRISESPDAVVRSLGTPPLPGREQIAGHYFVAIYQRAVMTAGALAASGGLLSTEELEREFDDSDD